LFFVQVVPSPFFSINQQTTRINPVSTQLLQTLNRDPRLRKVDNTVKPSTTHSDEVKQIINKNKDDKKLDRPKRDNSKHRESKRKERSLSHSPSKKEPSRKTYKKSERKERSPRDDKYHKKKNEKKSKEPELKKKNSSSNVKTLQNDTVILTFDLPIKDNEKLFKEELKTDHFGSDLPIVESIETNVPKEDEVIKPTEDNKSTNIITELPKTDSPLEDSDSLKRLHIYMQTVKKSPEPSTTPLLEPKNDSNIHGIKSNQSKIQMSDQPYFIIKYIVGDLLLFLNKLDTFLRHK